MRTTIAHNPFFGALQVTFERAGEQLLAAPGALVGRDASLEARTTHPEGGGDTAAGHTRAATTFIATAPGQSLWLAPPCDGSVESVALLPGAELYLHAGAWLASSTGVALDARWHGARAFFGSPTDRHPASTLVRAYGEGQVWFAAYGGFHVLDVGSAAAPTVCDTAHVVAFTHGLTHTIRQEDALGSPQGQGPARGGRLVTLSGQGRVWLQTRKPSALAAFLHPFRGVGGAPSR